MDYWPRIEKNNIGEILGKLKIRKIKERYFSKILADQLLIPENSQFHLL